MRGWCVDNLVDARRGRVCFDATEAFSAFKDFYLGQQGREMQNLTLVLAEGTVTLKCNVRAAAPKRALAT